MKEKSLNEDRNKNKEKEKELIGKEQSLTFIDYSKNWI